MKDLGTKRLETERLIIRKINLEDTHQIFLNWANDKKTNEYLTFKYHEDENQTINLIKSMISKYEKNGYEWCIELKNTHEVIGLISGDKSYKYNCVEISYSISSKYFNQGYTTEAIREVIRYLMEECEFDIVEAIIPSKNIGSIKVAEKCGLKKEAILKNRYLNKVTNEINDLLIYSKFR
jgi:RimJ/RimL family protein N-acetyltransferase